MEAFRTKQNTVRSTEKLKEITARRAAVIVPGAANAMFARLIFPKWEKIPGTSWNADIMLSDGQL